MNKFLIYLFLKINKVFPHKYHPFDDLKNGMSDMNYTDFEYSHCKDLLNQYKDFMNLEELKGKKILEIWCGWWWKIVYISEKYQCNAIGIDLNLHFLDQAEEKAKKHSVENNVKFLEMDALNMQFKDNEFDYVLMSDVLEHIPKTDILMKESLRVLKKWWKILFDFAPYYHYFGHHMWDTIQIPWLHIFTTEKFRVDLYKKSVEKLPDSHKRINLRIWKDKNWSESFTYLNRLTRKQFENIIQEWEQMWSFKNCTIKYFMLKNISIFWYIPVLRETFIRHIVWVIVK